jgi:predicted unusual protein kinase regulating ubiquinone biosynthesis (AarF/ABC1/UbiB family)
MKYNVSVKAKNIKGQMTTTNLKLANKTKPITLKDRRKRIVGLFRYLVIDIATERVQGRVLGKKYIEQRSEARNRRRARRFVETSLELGGVLIKLGQYLSTRFDLLPEVWLEELSRLQDSVLPVDFSLLLPVIEQDFGDTLDELFLEFNPQPLASASLGQVHEARLLDGTRVAVKVRRPGIEVIIEADLEALNRVIDFLQRRTDLGKLADLKGIAREFEVTLRRELDYVKEAESARRFKNNLKKLKYVYVPVVYGERSSGRVLTTEFIDGYKVTNYPAIEAAGLDRHMVARVLANCYLNQALIDGFFHADPHPGNIFVRSGPLGLQVVFIDFGMVGEITSEMRYQVRRLIFSVLNRDVDAIISSFKKLGFIRREEDVDKVRLGINYFLDKFIGISLGQLKALDRRKLFEEISYIIYNTPIYVPSEFSFMSRAFETLLGLCTSLSPQLNFTAEARPFMQRLLAEELGATNMPEGVTALLNFLGMLPGADNVQAFLKSPAGEQLRENTLQVISLPVKLNHTLERLESGRIQVQIQSSEVAQAAEKIQKSNERLLTAVLVSSFLISGVILATASAPIWATIFCLLVAVLISLRLFRQ